MVNHSAPKVCSGPYSVVESAMGSSRLSEEGEGGREGRWEGGGMEEDEEEGGETVGGKKTHSSAGGAGHVSLTRCLSIRRTV